MSERGRTADATAGEADERLVAATDDEDVDGAAAAADEATAFDEDGAAED